MSKQTLDGMARELMQHLEWLSRKFLLPQQTAELSRTELAVLRFLADHGASTMSDVSSALGVAHSSATGVVDTLVERKLVERRRPDVDRRQVLVALTRNGRRTHDGFIDDRTSMGVAMLEPLTAAESDRLLALFRKMTGEE
jgi:DNA-binding MarR family transcriptional regulator